jgi:hypothetical protein
MDIINGRLRRVTDLFVEGEEVFLGYDDNQEAVVVWVNKLNTFEIEEARRDGIVQRGLKMRDLGDPDNPERAAFDAEVQLMTDEKLQQAWVNHHVEEMYLDVVNDVESSEEWRVKVEEMRRMPTLLRDAGASDDDPRWKQLEEMQIAYMEALRAGQEQKQKESLREAQEFTRKDLEASYFEKWRERQTLDLFMEERRITEIYVASRECYAIGKPGGWDHSKCDHGKRLLPERALVKSLPPQVIEKIIDALDRLTTPQRDAGNSDAPVSSSASSEPSSVSEAPSTPSSPDETPSGVPTS